VRLVFSTEAWDDYQYWVAADKKVLKRTNSLIKDALRDPFEGIGHPEPLRHVLAGAWSRRITQEHRMVYGIEDGDLVIYQCRYHYER
jgi:toxin YoeB